MGIQRDEEFEKAYSEICKPIIARPYPRNEKGEYIYKEIHEANLMWQAKPQAVPEGFVVLTIDDVDRVLKCLDDDAVFITYKASDALESIRKAIIEAQEHKG